VAQNDVLVAFVVHYDNLSSTITPPTGWSARDDQISGAGNNHIRATSWYKVAGGSEPASYQWSGTGSPYTDIAILAYSGGDTGDPIDTSTEAGGENVATSYTATGLTTAINGEVLVCCAATYNGGTNIAGGMTDRGATGDNAVRVQDEVRATAGATGTRSADFWSTPDDFVALMIAVRPSVGGGGTTYPVALTAALAIAGALVKQAQRHFMGAFTLGETFPLVRGGTLAPSGAFSKGLVRGWAGVLSTAGSLGTIVGPFLVSRAGTLTTAGAFAKSFGKGLAGTLTTAGAIRQDLSLRYAGVLPLTGVMARAATRLLSRAGTLTTSGAIVLNRAALLSPAGTLTTSATLTLVQGQALSVGGTLFMSGAPVQVLAFRTPVPFAPEATLVVEELLPEFELLEEV
jgi:hypothetical protein